MTGDHYYLLRVWPDCLDSRVWPFLLSKRAGILVRTTGMGPNCSTIGQTDNLHDSVIASWWLRDGRGRR